VRIIPNSTQDMVELLIREKEYSITQLAKDLRLSQQTIRRMQQGIPVSEKVKLAVLKLLLRHYQIS
jgi:hypothetical protein